MLSGVGLCVTAFLYVVEANPGGELSHFVVLIYVCIICPIVHRFFALARIYAPAEPKSHEHEMILFGKYLDCSPIHTGQGQ